MELTMRRVYHFINLQYGKDAIRNRKIKISTLMGLNDPFELLAHDVVDRSVRKFLRLAKRQFAKEFGIICFSKESTSPVQWAHYADRHQGLCLGFDVLADMLKDVSYVANRFGKFEMPIKKNEIEWSEKVLSTKFDQWSYEKEARVFAELTDECNGLFFRNFNNELQLKEVVVGLNSPVSRAEISELLSDYSDVKAFKVRPAFRRFEMVENKDRGAWL